MRRARHQEMIGSMSTSVLALEVKKRLPVARPACSQILPAMRDRGGAVVKLTHGEVYLDWDTESNVGATYRIPTITVKNTRPRTKEYLSTVTHEAIHMALPDLSEATGAKAERDIAAILWARGFRLVTTRGKTRKRRASRHA